MKKSYLLFTVLFLTLAAMAENISVPENWTANINTALNNAARENKKILILFTGSNWCKYCKLLKSEVLDQPEFKKLAAEKFIAVYFDYPTGKALPAEQKKIQQMWAKKFNVGGFPTVVILNSNGKKIGEISGYRQNSKAEYIKQLESILKK